MHVLRLHSSIPAKIDVIALGRLAKEKVALKNNIYYIILYYILVLSEEKIIDWLIILALTCSTNKCDITELLKRPT